MYDSNPSPLIDEEGNVNQGNVAPVIVDKKADIERRRQEEIDNLFSRTQASTDKQLNTPVQKLSKEQVNKNIVKDFIKFREKINLPICLINGYGPTESTAYVCRQVITAQNVNDIDLFNSE